MTRKIKLKRKVFCCFFPKDILMDNLWYPLSVKNRSDYIKCTTLTLSSNCNSLKDNIDLDKGEGGCTKSMPK